MKNWTLPLRFHRPGVRRKGAPGRPAGSFRPSVEKLEDRMAPAVTAVGAGPGGQPLVTMVDDTGAIVHSFLAYDPGFTGGVKVALGDLTGDGVPDIITGAGAGGGPNVKIFDGVTFAEVRSFFAYDPNFTGGVSVAAADVNGDGAAEIITAAGAGGGPDLHVYDGRTGQLSRGFFAYDPNFTGGVNVAAADVNGDGAADIITGAGAGGGPDVKVFDGRTGSVISGFFAYDAHFTGGVNVAAGDYNGDGTGDILTGPGTGGGPDLGVWNIGPPPTRIAEFAALGGSDTGGVHVGTMPGSGGVPDLIEATSQNIEGPVFEYNLAGDVVDSYGVSGGFQSLNLSSDAPPSQLFTGSPQDEMPTIGNQPSMVGVKIYTDPTLFGLNKTITITNNSNVTGHPVTIYPFLEGKNDGNYVDPTTNNKTPYDTKDDPNQEYRAYIGFQQGTQYFFGLQPGKQVTLSVPLVFWDGARIMFSTNSKFFTNALAEGAANINNPYQYFAFQKDGKTPTLRFIDTASVSGSNGDRPVVMYYHGITPANPDNEAPLQLLELTIRDPYQFTLNPNLPDPSKPGNILGPLFNYDDSFVDSLAFPATLEAPSVPLLLDHSRKAPYGWIGAPQALDQFQTSIQNFTSDDPSKNGLGQYFGGQGWNSYFVPDLAMGIKLPSTKNLFESSPLKTETSTYNTGPTNSVQHFILSSGGVKYQASTNHVTVGATDGKVTAGSDTITNLDPAIMARFAIGMLTLNPDVFATGTSIASIGVDSGTNTGFIKIINGTQPAQALKDAVGAFTFIGSQFSGVGNVSGNQLTLTDASLVASLKPGMLVQIPDQSNPGQLVTIARIATTFDPSSQKIIPLDQSPTVPPNTTFTFSGAIGDYAAQTLLNLWYAWADYYAGYVASQTQQITVQNGNIAQPVSSTLVRDLTLPSGTDMSKLYPGMTVTGPAGVLNPNTVILSITGTTVRLSQYVKTGAINAPFTFGVPALIPRAGYVPANAQNPLRLSFSQATAADQAKANQFAQVVYAVMQEWSLIPTLTTAQGFNSLGFLADIIGGNIGQLPIGAPGVKQDTTELGKIYTNQSKSLERGVFDFLQIDESQWYPDPSQATAGATTGGRPAAFNLYNLDPYVWFVHKQLGVTGYAFSLDDDKADVGAGGATSIQIVVGGITTSAPDIGFPNKAEYSPGAPFGPEKSQGTAVAVAGSGPDKITGLNPDIFNFLIPPNLGDNVPGALVIGPGVVPGTRIASFDQGNNTVLLDHKLIGPPGPQPATYSFFGPVHATGTIDPNAASRQITNLDPDVVNVLNTITVNGSLLPGSLTVIGPGIKTTSGSAAAIGAVGRFPSAVTVGDFNGDSKLDAATANYGGDSVSVLLGTGSGTFATPTTTLTLPAGSSPFGIAAGKIGGSNNVSIVTANFGGLSVGVFLGNGNGTFQAPMLLPTKDSDNVSHKPYAIAVGDLNGDNLPDIAAVSVDGTYGIYLGMPGGAFNALLWKTALTPVSGVAIANLGNGPAASLVVSAMNANKIGVLLGNGDGTFKPPTFTDVGGSTDNYLAVGDFNKDNKIDVVTSNKDSSTVSLLLGNGNGTFAPATIFPVGATPMGITVGDFNQDGNLDVAVASLGANSGSVLFGTGAGAFEPALPLGSGLAPLGIASGAFNPSAGALDLVFTNFVGKSSDTVTLTGANPPTRIVSVDAANRLVVLDQALDPTQKAGTYRFKFT